MYGRILKKYAQEKKKKIPRIINQLILLITLSGKIKTFSSFLFYWISTLILLCKEKNTLIR